MQTKMSSLIEICLNVGSGFVLAWVTAILVLPLFLPVEKVGVSESFWITCIFTVLSLARGYAWRRFFNNKLKEGGHDNLHPC